MAVEFIMPFARANPSDFDAIKEKIQEKSPGIKKAVLERLGQFFAGFRDGTYDDDTIYGVACDLTSADVWNVVKPEELIPVLNTANSGTKTSFIDGLPKDYKFSLEKALSELERLDRKKVEHQKAERKRVERQNIKAVITRVAKRDALHGILRADRLDRKVTAATIAMRLDEDGKVLIKAEGRPDVWEAVVPLPHHFPFGEKNIKKQKQKQK